MEDTVSSETEEYPPFPLRFSKYTPTNIPVHRKMFNNTNVKWTVTCSLCDVLSQWKSWEHTSTRRMCVQTWRHNCDLSFPRVYLENRSGIFTQICRNKILHQAFEKEIAFHHHHKRNATACDVLKPSTAYLTVNRSRMFQLRRNEDCVTQGSPESRLSLDGS